MLIRAMVLYLRIRYNVFLIHNIAFTDCEVIKGQLFFWSFYFYCSVLVNPMIISTKYIDLYCVLSKQDTCQSVTNYKFKLSKKACHLLALILMQGNI